MDRLSLQHLKNVPERREKNRLNMNLIKDNIRTIKRRSYFSLLAFAAKYLPTLPAAPVTRTTLGELFIAAMLYYIKRKINE